MARRLRIAVLNRVFSPFGGGAERYSMALVEELAACHEIHVFAQQLDHNWPGVTYHKIPAPFVRPRWINQLWYAAATWWQTRRGFDVVHSHENTWHGNVQSMHVVPIMYNLFLGRTGWMRSLRWIKVLTSPRILVYWMFERARLLGNQGRNRVVMASEPLLSLYANQYPKFSTTFSVITPGVKTVGRMSDSVKLSSREIFGLPTTGTCLLFVGHDYQKKGLDALIRSLAVLAADIFLAVVGNPAQIPSFRKLASHLGVENRIFFLGSLPDVSRAYACADVLVHPTLEDSFAMVVLEAMATGLAVIVSGPTYCGISASLTNGVNAVILEDPKNVKRLASSIDVLVRDVATRTRVGDAAIEFARHRQWPLIAVRHEVIYLAEANRAAQPNQGVRSGRWR